MSNLLKDASILLTPTAYENGRMNAIKPSKDLYGSELVTNGDFSNGLTNWSTYGVTSVSSGVVTLGASANSGIFQGILTQGKKYKATINVTSYDGVGSAQVADDAGFVIHTITTTGLQTFYFEHSISNSNIIIRAIQNGVLSISSFSLVEDLSGDFNFERNSAATRVNAQGLVENVQIISPELVSNGNFSQIGTEEVLNGNFSQEGSELITNGDFAADSNWTGVGSNGWSIDTSAQTLNFTNASSYVFQGISTVQNKNYKVVIDVELTSGTLIVKSFNALNIITINTTGRQTITAYFTENDTNSNFGFIPSGSNVSGKIYNISVKEVGQNWTIENTWTIGDGVANGNGANLSTEELVQTNVNTIGKTYKATFEVLNYVSGSVGFWRGSGIALTQRSANGVYTEYFTATSNQIRFRGANFNGSITNISVKEVAQDWTLGTGWSVDQANSKATCDGTTSNLQQLSVDTSVIGKTYKISLFVSDYSSGFLSLSVGGYDYVSPTVTENGEHTRIIKITNTSSNDRLYIGSSSFNGSITNVSVKEITDDTNIPRINYEGFSYQDSLGSEEIVNGDFATDSNWSKGDGWSIGSGKANCDGTQTATTNFFQSNVISDQSKTYKVEFTLSNYVSGSVKSKISNDAQGLVRTANGTYIDYLSGMTNNQLNFTASSDFIGSIDKVSVKEYLGQEVVPDSGCGSWLLEPQRTNSLLQSNQFDTTWTPTNSSVTSGQTGVGGSSNAWLLESTGDASSARITQTVLVSGDLSYSFYAKKGTTDSLGLRSQDSSTATWFNLSSGAVYSTGGSASNAQIKDVGAGWYRCSIVFDSCTSVRIYFSDSPGSYAVSDGANIYIQYSQLELGGFTTSYIPTNGATNTRLQDIATNSGNSTLINSTEGVLYAEIAALTDDGSNRNVSLSKDALNRVNIFYRNGSNRIRFVVRINSANLFDASITLSDITNYNKVALSFKENEFKAYVNGVKEAEQLSGSIFPADTLDKLGFNQNNNGSLPFHGKVKAVAVYKEALTDAELQSLTTI